MHVKSTLKIDQYHTRSTVRCILRGLAVFLQPLGNSTATFWCGSRNQKRLFCSGSRNQNRLLLQFAKLSDRICQSDSLNKVIRNRFKIGFYCNGGKKFKIFSEIGQILVEEKFYFHLIDGFELFFIIQVPFRLVG